MPDGLPMPATPATPDAPEPYPGDAATAAQILRLAAEYRAAARLVLTLGRKGHPLSRAPYRLTAIHAIELYLNALLLHRGHPPAAIRRLRHDLGTRTDLAVAAGLALRRLTARHLSAMTGSREYVVSRYGPEMSATTMSQINRLTATLDEVADKVTEAVTGRKPPAAG